MPQMLTSLQISMLLIVITAAVLFTCFSLSRLKLLPSLSAFQTARYLHMDGMRGLAALLVFLNHLPLMLINLDIYNKHFYLIATPALEGLGTLGIQIFFGITGFLFTAKILNAKNGFKWGDFYANRIKRLVPLYFFAVTLALLIAFFMRTQMPSNVVEIGHTVINCLKAYGFGFFVLPSVFGFNLIFHLLGNVWTLPYEWRFYLLMPAFFWLIKGNGPFRLALVLLLAIAFIDLMASSQALWVFFLSGFFAAFLRQKISTITTNERKICVILGIIALIIPFFTTKYNCGLQSWVLRTIGFILIVIAEPSFLKTKTLRFLGEVSYSFYLLSGIISYCVFNLLRHAYLAAFPFRSFVFWEALTAGMVIIVCTITFRFIEYPFLKRRHTDMGQVSRLPAAAITT